MKQASPNKSSPLDSLLSLLGVFEEPLFHWLLQEERRPQGGSLIFERQTPWELIQHLSLLLESSLPYLETAYEEILPSVWVAKGVRIHGTATLLGPLVLGEAVDIGPEVQFQGPLYLGKRVRIDRGVELRSSILCEGVRIGAESIVLDSILGREVVLEERVTTLTRGETRLPLTVEYPCGVFHPTAFHRLGSYICPRTRVRRGQTLKAGTILS
jgi:NDP-sugar pyrophosphorylase family protein